MRKEGEKNNKKPFKKGGRPDDRNKLRRDDKKDPQAAKDQLDREMENYWLKTGNKDLGKTLQIFNFIV